MQPTSRADRERELEGLLAQLRDHPEHAMTAERQRAAVLRQALAAPDAAA